MQCVNCGFENIPGMDQCVRCQSSLALATVEIAPPRAGRRRMGSRLRRLWNPFRQGMRAPLPIVSGMLSRWWPGLHRAGTAWEGLVCSLIPGLGHIRHSDKASGRFLLACWLVCFPLMLMTIGWGLNWLFLAIAIAMHAFSILSFLGAQLTESRPLARAAFGILLFAGLWLGIYMPAGALLSCFYTPFPVQGIESNGIVADGDALLYQGPWLRPVAFHRGDLVIYRIHAGAGGHGGYFIMGFGLDRVIGLPGDIVTINDGKIMVNGSPLGPDKAPIGIVPSGHHEVHVDQGRYMILPSAAPLWARGVDPGPGMVGLSLVSRADVLGRVVLRINPLWRFGRVQ